ncbi:MAG: EamA family transporter, partial [Lacipirellulaceae bacterium]
MPRWLFWMVVTLACWGVWGVLLRIAPTDLSPAQCQALSTLGLLPIFVLLWRLREPEPTSEVARGVWLAIAAGVVSSIGNVAFYAALATAPASIVVPFTAMSPAIAVLLAWPVLGERLAPWQWGG